MFDQFLKGLELAAVEKKTTLEIICEKIAHLHGPEFKGTKAQYNKFHDDKTLYTGVHKMGGPTTVDKGKIVDLSYLANRHHANIRGVNDEIMELSKEQKDEYEQIM